MIDDPSIDVRVTALHVLKNLAKHNHTQVASSAAVLVALALPRAKDRKVVRIKFAAERLLLHLLKIQDGTQPRACLHFLTSQDLTLPKRRPSP